jgi:hypothetical protein
MNPAITAIALFLAVTAGCKPVVIPDPTCDSTDAGECTGTCPAGEVCSSRGPTACACVPEAGSPFCGFNGAHVCAGPCPTGQTCAPRGATVCACVPNS